jgi:hypothetical protein
LFGFVLQCWKIVFLFYGFYFFFRKEENMATINIQIDDMLKNRAEDFFSNLGLDISSAVNMLLQQVMCSRSVVRSKLISAQRRKNCAKLGGWEGKVWMSDDFDEPLEDFKEYM